MKVLITGARGNFPMALIPDLVEVGHELVLLDQEPMDAPEGCVSMQADVRDGAAVLYGMQGCDAVIHAAGHHHQSAQRNIEDLFEVNITGTHNVLRAMQLLGVKYLVFSSCDSVYGDGMRGIRVMDEEVKLKPTSYMGLAKKIDEELCEYFARTYHMHVAILRYGCFAPADWRVAGLGRLANWIDRLDVAQANELALGAICAEEFTCETFLVHSAKPFTDTDWPELAISPDKVIEHYYPGAVELLANHGLHVPHIHTRYDISKAVSMLGYEPQHNFEQFLSRLRTA
jgi:nucleoside-diphosphate-sugar epimerase